MSQATYTIVCKVNGETLQGTSVKVKFGGFRREDKTAAGIAGRDYVEIPEASMVTVTILHTEDTPPIDVMRNWKNVTLVLECDNGKTYQCDGAKVSNAFELGDEGGGITLEFTGPPITEV